MLIDKWLRRSSIVTDKDKKKNGEDEMELHIRHQEQIIKPLDLFPEVEASLDSMIKAARTGNLMIIEFQVNEFLGVISRAYGISFETADIKFKEKIYPNQRFINQQKSSIIIKEDSQAELLDDSIPPHEKQYLSSKVVGFLQRINSYLLVLMESFERDVQKYAKGEAGKISSLQIDIQNLVRVIEDSTSYNSVESISKTEDVLRNAFQGHSDSD